MCTYLDLPLFSGGPAQQMFTGVSVQALFTATPSCTGVWGWAFASGPVGTPSKVGVPWTKEGGFVCASKGGKQASQGPPGLGGGSDTCGAGRAAFPGAGGCAARQPSWLVGKVALSLLPPRSSVCSLQKLLPQPGPHPSCSGAGRCRQHSVGCRCALSTRRPALGRLCSSRPLSGATWSRVLEESLLPLGEVPLDLIQSRVKENVHNHVHGQSLSNFPGNLLRTQRALFQVRRKFSLKTPERGQSPERSDPDRGPRLPALVGRARGPRL